MFDAENNPKPGLNFYPKNNPRFGFKFLVPGKFMFAFAWHKKQRKFWSMFIRPTITQ